MRWGLQGDGDRLFIQKSSFSSAQIEYGAKINLEKIPHSLRLLLNQFVKISPD
ncbi:MAG: hypothetical protein HC799_00105 [Limnothrix sp. RL_2_0]|nr:hypothetical protein [Limnothrix sp. RL_2_0]